MLRNRPRSQHQDSRQRSCSGPSRPKIWLQHAASRLPYPDTSRAPACVSLRFLTAWGSGEIVGRLLISSSQLTIVVLALSFVSCTVAPVFVFAEDTVSITNVARSSISTGGQDGQDGKDGRPGENGADGAPGEAGVSITNTISGENETIVKVKSVVDGQTVLDYESKEVEAVDSFVFATSSNLQTEVSAETSTMAVSSTTEVENSWHRLNEIIHELQLIIITYVSHLF